MKKLSIILIGLWAIIPVFAQEEQSSEPACSCPSCLAEASGEKLPYTLAGLQELNEESGMNTIPEQTPQEHERHDDDAEESGHEGHDHDAPAGHDHDAEEDGHEGHDHDAHAGHDHDAEEVGHEDHAVDPHAGHDHAEEAVVELSDEMIEKVGIQVHEAEGGSIAKASVFPAEIKLNRNTTAAVSPRYASIVRQVFGEIGDTVKKGDVLASLENRESMAVYTVAAPLDGVIIAKDLAVGESAGEDRVLYEVADLSSVWADISVFPKYQHQLRKGMPVKFVAHDGHITRGSVKYISPIVSHETRTFTARCVLKGADEDFTPGAFVRALIHIETVEAEVRVPLKAVQTLEGETVVFIPEEHGFLTRPVELGLADDHNVEIKGGLEAGESYVAVGAFTLKAQMITSGLDPHAGHGH
jgi:cobalt-zinc-cadmium efflux system membrane fusion protein